MKEFDCVSDVCEGMELVICNTLYVVEFFCPWSGDVIVKDKHEMIKEINLTDVEFVITKG